MDWARARLAVIGTIIAIAAATIGHRGHVENDAVRHESSASVELMMIPSGEALRVGSLGYAMHLADLLWIRSVLTFGERMSQEPDPAWQEWLARMLDAVTTLDPQWRTPYFYGGVMLRVTGDYDNSTALLTKGHQALPEDFFFPFAVGMNHYMGKEDPVEAARWVRIAASLPGAPDWYEAAATGFILQTAQRQVAIRFLREELEVTTDPELREPLERKIRSLMHEEIVERFDGFIADYSERFGAPPATPEALVQAGLLERLPPDPLEGRWVIDVDGRVVSDVEVEDLLRRAVARERQMLTTHKKLELE